MSGITIDGSPGQFHPFQPHDDSCRLTLEVTTIDRWQPSSNPGSSSSPPFAGWITRQQDAAIEYLREENRVLKQQLGPRRLRLTDDQRRCLAVRGKAIGRRALAEVA